MPTLFDLGAELERVAESLENHPGTGQSPLEDYFKGLCEDRDRKIDSYVYLMKEFSSRASVRKAEADRLSKLAKSDQAQADALRDRLQLYFELHEISKLETPEHRFTLAENGGSPPVQVDDSTDIAKYEGSSYVRKKLEWDKTAILAALLEGEALTFAKIGDKGQTLQIK